MTASLGVGKAQDCDEAMRFILHKCANMDAREIAFVRENKEELSQHSDDPEEGNVQKLPQQR